MLIHPFGADTHKFRMCGTLFWLDERAGPFRSHFRILWFSGSIDSGYFHLFWRMRRPKLGRCVILSEYTYICLRLECFALTD